MDAPQLLSNEVILNKTKSLENWEIIQMHHLRSVFNFKDFKEALNFVVEIGNIAETMQHHPEIILSPGRVEIVIFTEDSGGLTDLDFEFAKKVNKINKSNKKQ